MNYGFLIASSKSKVENSAEFYDLIAELKTIYAKLFYTQDELSKLTVEIRTLKKSLKYEDVMSGFNEVKDFLNGTMVKYLKVIFHEAHTANFNIEEIKTNVDSVVKEINILSTNSTTLNDKIGGFLDKIQVFDKLIADLTEIKDINKQLGNSLYSSIADITNIKLDLANIKKGVDNFDTEIVIKKIKESIPDMSSITKSLDAQIADLNQKLERLQQNVLQTDVKSQKNEADKKAFDDKLKNVIDQLSSKLQNFDKNIESKIGNIESRLSSLEDKLGKIIEILNTKNTN